MPSKQKRAGCEHVSPRVKVWLEIDGEYIFGFGLSEILKAVGTAGSIKGGADVLQKSYRHIWGRIKKAEQALGYQLVETRVGGKGTSRSSLTDFAEQLIHDFDALRTRTQKVVADEFSERFEGHPAAKETRRPKEG